MPKQRLVCIVLRAGGCSCERAALRTSGTQSTDSYRPLYPCCKSTRATQIKSSARRATFVAAAAGLPDKPAANGRRRRRRSAAKAPCCHWPPTPPSLLPHTARNAIALLATAFHATPQTQQQAAPSPSSPPPTTLNHSRRAKCATQRHPLPSPSPRRRTRADGASGAHHSPDRPVRARSPRARLGRQHCVQAAALHGLTQGRGIVRKHHLIRFCIINNVAQICISNLPTPP